MPLVITCMRHKIPEAGKMVGRDRKTLYRHMKQGKLSYGLDEDGNRFIETSELIRVYKKLRTPETIEKERIDDLDNIKATTTTDKLLRHLVEEVRLLREENIKQGEQLEDIRHQIADKPLLVASEKLSHHDEKPEDTQNHSFSALIQKIKESSD